MQKLARKHGIARWPYRSIKAHATAALCQVASGSAPAANPAQPARLSHPGTPASSPLVAHSTAQAGSANRALSFVPAGAATDPAFVSAGSGNSSMQVFMLPGGGSGQAVLVPGSGSYEAVGWGTRPAQLHTLCRSSRRQWSLRQPAVCATRHLRRGASDQRRPASQQRRLQPVCIRRKPQGLAQARGSADWRGEHPAG